MFKPFAVFFVFIMLINSACAVSAPKPSSTEVRVSIEAGDIKFDPASTNLAGDIKFTITNISGKSQYVIIAPAECAADEDDSTTPTPECKEQFIEQSLGSVNNNQWELSIHLDPGDYVIESMVMASGPLQLSKTYFTVIAP